MKKPARALGEVLSNLFKEKATCNYPFEKAVVDARFRGRIAFESDKCIGCKMCVRACPAKAIEIILSAEQPAAQLGGWYQNGGVGSSRDSYANLLHKFTQIIML